MSKTLIEIPDDLMGAARDVVGPSATKAETVRTALELMVRHQRQLDALEWFRDVDPLRDLRNAAIRSRARS